ncbi:TetR/AcrR family transcriptional regulator [Amycolatopsis sp. H20-H5]|uniref:TetR/AcrR family transcriptional regulator n=1 Tax=Amycolatopsis sp. H20-H5 TaxID=3046309 RepID=UPI002DBAA0C0|nr:TetR/AcrR family transcriptional regulator [Amycolatopsis sp. H20-H5]MEC3981689.1 TetR/AcrR family transcriptional regulator [Amycolatopsis sp. H20-H5]
MARPKEFDEQQAVDAAMNAFWDRGYEGTSTQDLCAATGLGRSSIYNTFSSKHELFQRSLEHYSVTGVHTRNALLDTAEDGLDRIRALLEGTVAEELKSGHRGCLMVNTAAEFGDRDAAVNARVRADTESHLAMLAGTIRTGQADGTITTGRAAAELAQFVHASIGGLRLMSRGGAGEPEMLAVAEIALGALAA